MPRTSASIDSETRTIHSLIISVADDALAGIGFGDTVEIILTSRYGGTTAKRLTPRDVAVLLEGGRTR